MIAELVTTNRRGRLYSGQLILTTDDQVYELNAGDSFRFAGMMQWKNEGDVEAVVIWVIAPIYYHYRLYFRTNHGEK